MHFFDWARSPQKIIRRETENLKGQQKQLSRECGKLKRDIDVKTAKARAAYKRGDTVTGRKYAQEAARFMAARDRFDKGAKLLDTQVHHLIEARTGVALTEALKASTQCLKKVHTLTATGAAQAVEENATYMERNSEAMKQMEDELTFDQDQVDENTEFLAQQIEEDILADSNMINLPTPETNQPQTNSLEQNPELVETMEAR